MSAKTIPIDRAVQIASEIHRAGQLERAEAMYVEILKQDPGNVDAIHLLGVLANQGGEPEVAVKLIGRALQRRPDEAMIHFNYADALSRLRRFEPAAEHYARAAALAPQNYDAHTSLAGALFELGRFADAERACHDAIAIDSWAPQAYNNLGNALRHLHRFDEALRTYERALERKPDFPEALSNMGLLLDVMGRSAEAIEKLHAAIQARPGMEDAHNALGVVFTRQGRAQEAIACLETALKLNPDHPDASNNLGLLLRAQGHFAQALPLFEKAAELRPKAIQAHINRSQLLKDMGRMDDALAAIEQAIQCNAKSVPAHFTRALILRDMRRADDAIDAHRDALKLAPDAADIMASLGYALQERGELDEALELLNRSISTLADPQLASNALLVMTYHPAMTPVQLYQAHCVYAAIHEEPCKARWKPHGNSRDPQRKLRVGYFSPDFRGHSVSFFTWPILENHDREQFEVYAYANNFASDATTILQRARIDQWRDTMGRSPDQVADMIRADGIDILVELAGHTALNGLPVLWRKPAPIQINGIGYPCTTGLSAVDYRITDARCDPPGAEAHNSEKLLRMADIFWCYQPPDPSPEVGPLPADRNGFVTFVSVNNFTKVTPQVLQSWAKILAAVPNSRMVIQTMALNSLIVQQRVRAIFADAGVAPERLDLRVWSDFRQYLELLTNCDIMLDTFPFNGGTTTCHALWMGVPVVSLAGQVHCGRMGLSMLHGIGLPEWCTSTPEQYIEFAIAAASDRDRLREIRAGMRSRLEKSPLLDAVRYVRNLESAYRDVWRAWCNSESAR